MMGDNLASASVSASGTSVRSQPLSEFIHERLTKSGVEILTRVVNLETQLQIYEAQISELRLQLEQAKSDKAKRFELPKAPLLEMKETVAQTQRATLQPQLQMQMQQNTKQKDKMREEKKKTVIATPAQIQHSQLKQQVLQQLMDKEKNEGGRQAEQTEHAKHQDEEEHKVRQSRNIQPEPTATSTQDTQQRQEGVKNDVQKEDSTLTETDCEMGSAKADKAGESGNVTGQILDHIDFSKPPPNVVSVQLPPATTQTEVKPAAQNQSPSTLTSVPASTVISPSLTQQPQSLTHPTLLPLMAMNIQLPPSEQQIQSIPFAATPSLSNARNNASKADQSKSRYADRGQPSQQQQQPNQQQFNNFGQGQANGHNQGGARGRVPTNNNVAKGAYGNRGNRGSDRDHNKQEHGQGNFNDNDNSPQFSNGPAPVEDEEDWN